MNAEQATVLLEELRSKPLDFGDLQERLRAVGSPWTGDQLCLFLKCSHGLQFDKARGTWRLHPAESADLAGGVLDVVRSFAGKPVAAHQVRARLPDHFLSTDEQVVAIARNHPGLEVFGPNLIKIAK